MFLIGFGVFYSILESKNERFKKRAPSAHIIFFTIWYSEMPKNNSKIEKMKGQTPKIFSAPSAPFYMKITFFGLLTVFVDRFEIENPLENQNKPKSRAIKIPVFGRNYN